MLLNISFGFFIIFFGLEFIFRFFVEIGYVFKFFFNSYVIGYEVFLKIMLNMKFFFVCLIVYCV